MKIEQQLQQLEERLKARVNEMGQKKSVEILGEKQSTLSYWLNGKRKWSYKKIIKHAKKLKLEG